MLGVQWAKSLNRTISKQVVSEALRSKMIDKLLLHLTIKEREFTKRRILDVSKLISDAIRCKKTDIIIWKDLGRCDFCVPGRMEQLIDPHFRLRPRAEDFKKPIQVLFFFCESHGLRVNIAVQEVLVEFDTYCLKATPEIHI
jgi:hypothetical protein